MKKIVCLETGFPPELASSRLSFEFAQELTGRDYDIVVVTTFPKKYLLSQELGEIKSSKKFFYWEIMDNVKVLRVWPQFVSKSPTSRALEYLVIPISLFLGGLIVGKKDLIHCDSPPLLVALIGCILGKITRTPIILRTQDLHPDGLIKAGILKNKLFIKFLELIEKFVYLRSNKITVIAEGYKKHIISKGITPNKIILIPNWADTSKIPSVLKSNDFRINNNLSNKFIVTYAGTMSWAQDLETVIEAAHILKDHKDIVFLLVGEGVKKELLMKKSKELKLKNTIFMPLQPRNVYFKILYASNACLVPLRKNYKSPTAPSKMLEIMACSKPIIANVPYKSEVHKLINKAQCGIWVEPENPKTLSQTVLNLYENREFAHKLGKKGREFVKKHLSLMACMNEYEKLIKSFFVKI